VTYTSKHYIFFYIGQMAILLYKLWGWRFLVYKLNGYSDIWG
jgi:hypothetical protein